MYWCSSVPQSGPLMHDLLQLEQVEKQINKTALTILAYGLIVRVLLFQDEI